MTQMPRRRPGTVYQTYVVIDGLATDVGHVCGTCRISVTTDELVTHAGDHEGIGLGANGDQHPSARREGHVPRGPSTVQMMTLVSAGTVVHVCARCDEQVAKNQLRDHACMHVEREQPSGGA